MRESLYEVLEQTWLAYPDGLNASDIWLFWPKGKKKLVSTLVAFVGTSADIWPKTGDIVIIGQLLQLCLIWMVCAFCCISYSQHLLMLHVRLVFAIMFVSGRRGQEGSRNDFFFPPIYI